MDERVMQFRVGVVVFAAVCYWFTILKTLTFADGVQWDAQIVSITENGPFNYTAQYADPTPILQDADYTFLLPSANFTWHFTDALQLRAGVAKTMARPPVDQLAPTNTTEKIGRAHV